MSTYSNRLQPALQILLECVVRFFHPRSSCMTHISAYVFGRRKSLVKPVMRQKTRDAPIMHWPIIVSRVHRQCELRVLSCFKWTKPAVHTVDGHVWGGERGGVGRGCAAWSITDQSPPVPRECWR